MSIDGIIKYFTYATYPNTIMNKVVGVRKETRVKIKEKKRKIYVSDLRN